MPGSESSAEGEDGLTTDLQKRVLSIVVLDPLSQTLISSTDRPMLHHTPSRAMQPITIQQASLVCLRRVSIMLVQGPLTPL